MHADADVLRCGTGRVLLMAKSFPVANTEQPMFVHADNGTERHQEVAIEQSYRSSGSFESIGPLMEEGKHLHQAEM